MAVTVLLASDAIADEFAAPLQGALQAAGISAELVRQADPATVDYIIYAPSSPLHDFAPFVRAKAVLSVWAGVERIVGNATLTQPLCRMVEDGLTEGMVEYVTGHVLRHHLGMDRHIVNPLQVWDATCPPLARERVVAMLGMGALGTACAQALLGLNFRVVGWSRTSKDVPGMRCLAGENGLREALGLADFVVTLLPKTPETEGLLDARRLSWLKRGAVVLNPGRGALIDDAALLAALDRGQVGHATLDVFRSEPLPQDHAFWQHPRVTVTPHIAADTRAGGAAKVLAENIRRGEAGEAFLHRVDRGLGY